MVPMNFMDRFVSATFKDISHRGFVRNIFSYIIDSKFRTRMRVDAFLEVQVREPDLDLLAIAQSMREQYPNPDRRIVEILKLVYEKVKYVSDQRSFGRVEYWASAAKTWNRKRDDCDGINALIYVLARLSGISPLQLWSAIGTTTVGGHYWLVYFSFKTDKWCTIDGTYNVDLRPVSLRTPFTLRATRYQKIWAVFNDYSTYIPK